ncbi:MAG: TolC family protein [Bacteroidales bacterium]|nr:TolC family protein [Bacteroidales bacterium]
MKNRQNTKAVIDNIELIKENKTHAKLYVITSIYISIIFFTSFSAKAQEKWNLAKCIDYAIENNIELNQSNNNTDLQRVNLNESKVKLLPTLNLGSGMNMSFGRNIDGNTNAITFDQTLSNNYWINSSIDIFQGLVNYHSIKLNKFLLLATKEEDSYLKNKLALDVITSYYTVLYSKGIEEVALNQLALSEVQHIRMQKLVDIGREPQVTVLELKSQWASDKLILTQATNNYNKTLLELKQLLRLDLSQDFSIDTISISSILIAPIQNIDSLFNIAVNILPEIKQQEYLIKASEKDLAVTKGRISPRIYMSLAYNTGYFDGDPLGYSDQISNNQNQGINMGINIPIFNNAATYSNIQRKNIALKNRELDLQKQKNVLYSEIWNAVEEMQSAEDEYHSAMELYSFSELTLESASKKLEAGLASPTDYELAKQRFISAKASLLKTKLIYMMRKQMLKFYQSGNWNHLQG